MRSNILIDVGPATGAHGQRGIGRYVRGLVRCVELLPADLAERVWAVGEVGDVLDTLRPRTVERRQRRGGPASSWLTGPPATRAAIRRSSASILHQTDPHQPWSWRGVASIVTVYDLIPLTEPGLIKSWRRDYQARYRWYLHQVRSASRVLAISEATARDVEERLEVDRSRIDIVYPVVVPAQRLVRCTPEVPTFLYTGALDPHKQPELAVRALAVYRSRGNVGRLRMIGPASPGRVRKVMALAAGLGVGDAVRVEGHLTDQELDRAFATATALLWVSRNEGFGLPPVEAVVRGLPVIAVETPAARETLQGAATLVPSDPDAMATAMVAPETPPDSSVEAIIQRFAPEAAARSIERSYRWLLG